MKKIFLYIMFVAVGLGLQSCLHDNDEVFEKSAAERVDAVINEADALLESAQYGWVLHYFMGIDYAYGGNTYTISFKNGKATFRCVGEFDDNGNYLAETSTYKLNRDQGPVIIFDTYNDLLHFYGDPAGETSPTEVDGYQADFQFVIMSISEDKNTIRLKGKKFGDHMVLERLTVPAEQYLDAVGEVSDIMEGNILTSTFSGKEVSFNIAQEGFVATFTGDDGQEVSEKSPYYVTPEGLVLMEPFEVLGQTISGVQYVANSGEFPITDNPSQKLVIDVNIFNQFLNGKWYIDANNMSASAREGFMSFVMACATVEGELVSEAFIGTATNYAGTAFGFHFVSGGYVGTEEFLYETSGENTITFKQGASIANGDYYRKNCSLGDATAPFYTTFTLERDRVVAPREFTLRGVKDTNLVIKLTKSYVPNPGHLR